MTTPPRIKCTAKDPANQALADAAAAYVNAQLKGPTGDARVMLQEVCEDMRRQIFFRAWLDHLWFPPLCLPAPKRVTYWEMWSPTYGTIRSLDQGETWTQVD